ncbi:MAG TPA: tetratricopeptide repeat protein [Nitrospirota bacterium]|nr:tetratricopeptide repeat protein [Nitrospirota bacterium]
MRQKKYRYFLAAIVSLATFSLYIGALRNDFLLWDDQSYVSSNYHIRALDWSLVRWAATTFYSSNWHPLTWISHALDYAVWGLNPMGHHLTNVLLHAANSFLVVILYLKLRDLWLERSMQAADRDAREWRLGLMAAGVAGLLFGLHPVHVESVAWVSERKDLLCGLFFLLTLLAYANYVNSPSAVSSRMRPRSFRNVFLERSYLLSIACCALALMSKPMAVSLPVVLLILDWFPFKRIDSPASFRSVLLEKMPFIVLGAIVSLLTMMAQRSGGAMELTDIVPLWARVLVAVKAIIAYLGHMALPVGLSPHYPYPKPHEIAHLAFGDLAGYLLVIALIAVFSGMMKDRSLLLAVLLYYGATLLPVLGIVQVGSQAMADRYTYLPSLGPFFLVGTASAWAWDRPSREQQRGRMARYGLAAALVVVMVTLSMATVRQVSVWRNNIELWSSVIEHGTVDVPFAYVNRGSAYAKQGRHDLAMKDYDRAIALYPSDAEAYNSRGMLYEKLGQLDRAREDYDKAIAHDPSNASAYSNRGIIYGEMGRYDLALDDLTMAISLRPGHADDHIRRGRALRELGQYARALDDYTYAITLDPAKAEAFNGRSIVYKYTGQYDLALADCDKAIELNPSLYLAYCNRAVVLEKMGRAELAIKDYSRALALRPDVAQIYFERAQLYLRTGERNLASNDFRKACTLGGTAGCDMLRKLR